MARTRPPRPAPVPEHNSLIASVVRIPPQGTTAGTGRSQSWQAEAWRFYDTIGELRFVTNWVGNVMSGATLVAAKNVDGVLRVERDGPGAQAMAAFYGGLDGQREFLRASGLHLTIPGHFWSVYHEEQWYTLSYRRVQRTGKDGPLTADFGDGKRVPLTRQSIAMRVWQPHPDEPLYADSPVRSSMDVLEELRAANLHVRAQMLSRLAGSGLLLLPSEMEFPAAEGQDPNASKADAFMAVLAEAMMTPIKDPGSPAAVVPIVVTSPGEHLKEVKHLSFWTPLDEKVLAIRDSAIKRLATGMDVPQEVLLGMGEQNHWNAWLIDEASVKSHLVPRLGVVTAAVTEGYLRPALAGHPDADDYYVLADTATIRLRPNRSREAIELWDRGELGGEAMRRETGFHPEDAPDADEKRQWLLRKVAIGSTSPEQTQAALRMLGADLGVLPGAGVNVQIPPVLEGRRSLEGHPTHEVPDMGRTQDDRRAREGLVSAADVLVYRALERVGNRLCNGAMKAQLSGVQPQWRYLHVDAVPENALEGAWGFAGEVLEATGSMVETARICAALDGYVRFLLEDRRKHDRAYLEAALIAAGVVGP